MGIRGRHEPGSFSWTDLSTPDAQASMAFYGGLFGWDFEENPIPDGGAYVVATLGGHRVAAMFETSERHPAWASYVTVEEVDATAARASELGANLIAEPFDVMDAGRMATIQDPTGAVFCVWEPRRSIGAELVNAPGALTLNQLNTSDPEAAARFYYRLFGWRVEQAPGTNTPYFGIYLGERLNGGLTELPPGSPAPSHWLVYFGFDHLDAAVSQLDGTDAAIMVPPQEVPGGRILVAQDPQGAFFALVEGRFDD
jgi:predicted enzyme related to lactoylglutathione lyase